MSADIISYQQADRILREMCMIFNGNLSALQTKISTI